MKKLLFIGNNAFAVNKEAIFIILGAGGRIDQEYNAYVKDLNKEIIEEYWKNNL